MKHVIAVGEGFSKLGIFSKGPPLSLFDMLIATKGVQKLDVPLVVCLLGGYFISWTWVLPFNSLFPFFGCFGFFTT